MANNSPDLFLQTQVDRLIRERSAEAVREYGLTLSQWGLLGLLAEARDGRRHTDIAEVLCVKPPLVTAMSKQLLKRGLIQSVTNQFDARAKLLALTSDGRKFIIQVETTLGRHLNELFNGLTKQELADYQKVLRTIIANGRTGG
ncbi:MAG TPA: MarR family transcriptional regulator [Candidatus Saccharimonadales bacterium]|nr:MarR family transcriptional regulator [Candidatus Saccharimonadales bacterium]